MEEVRWYALRVIYHREMRLKSFLDERGIVNFLPMRYVYKEGKKKVLVPAIRNLIFVRSNREKIDEIRAESKYKIPFHYVYDKTKEVTEPVVVPERQMESFIAVAGTYDEKILFLNRIPQRIRNGDRVRVTGGVFEGVEGEIVRIKRDRRVVVSIDGFIAVATAFIHPSLLEKIND